MPNGILNRRAILALVIAQMVLAINWFDAGAVYSLIATDLNQNISGLGLISSALLVGVAAFQLPAGIASAKLGPKRTMLYGALLTSFSSLLVGIAGDIYLMAILRFVEGVGMAFTFAPGASLISKYFRRGSEGLALGLYEASYASGGIIGIFGWAVLGEAVGWRVALTLVGPIGLFSGYLLLTQLPKETGASDFRVKLIDLRNILLDRFLIVLSLVLLALQVGMSLNGYFMVFYLEEHLRVSIPSAGFIESLTLFSGCTVAPIVGRLHDRIGKPTRSLFVIGMLSALGLSLTSLDSLAGAVLSTFILGSTTSAGFTIGFDVAQRSERAQNEYVVLRVAWVNGISLFGSFGATAAFALLVIQFNYPVAWLLSGVAMALLVLPLLTVRRERPSDSR